MRRASVDAEADAAASRPRRGRACRWGTRCTTTPKRCGACTWRSCASHATQLDAPVFTSMSTKVEAGHSARHSPAAVMNASVSPHVRQSVVAAPLHVSHVASQGSHAILVRFAHMNSARARGGACPGRVENGERRGAACCTRRRPGRCTSHSSMAPLARVQTCVALPPAHVHPSSIAVQFSPQPSPATRRRRRTPAPRALPVATDGAHASGVVSEPPEHDQPGSTAHDAEQPSPPTVLLSSQPSAVEGHARCRRRARAARRSSASDAGAAVAS